MPDNAHIESDELLLQLETDLRRLYAQASRRIQREIEDLLEQIYLDDETATQRQRMKYAEKNGNKNKLIEIFVAMTVLTNEKAMNQINKQLDNIYTVNHNAVIDKILRKTDIELTTKEFNLNKLISRYTKRAYARNTNESHARREYVREINKMLKNGDGTKKIAKRLEKVFGKSETSARATALTETTRIQSRGRLDVMQEGKRQGMVFKKIWRHSPHVKAPRDWHMAMDGETVDLDKPFSNGLDAPGDYNAPAEEVINCHCFLDEELIDW